MSYTPAARAREELARSNGDHDKRPWSTDAEQLLVAAELAEAGARSAVTRAGSLGAPDAEQARVDALLERAEVLRISLARRKKLNAITSTELGKARAALAQVQSGQMNRASAMRANRRRLDRLENARRSVRAEFESARSSAEMVQQMMDALFAENQRAAGHMTRLREGTALNDASCLVDRSYKALTRLEERAQGHLQRGDAGAMPRADWDRAVDDLARIRHDLDRLEARLRLGAI